MKIDVWISVGINIDVDDPHDYIEIAEKALQPLLDRVQGDKLYECIEEVTGYDPETGYYDIPAKESQEDNSPSTLRYRDDGESEQ